MTERINKMFYQNPYSNPPPMHAQRQEAERQSLSFLDSSKYNVRHSGVSENFKINYIEFQELPKIPHDQEFFRVLEETQQLLSTKDWIK